MTRALRWAATAAASGLALLLVTGMPAASADPAPDAQAWPTCFDGTDTDGRYCIVSATRDGVPLPAPGAVEPYPFLTIDLMSPGAVRFSVQTYDGGVTGDLGNDIAAYSFTVNTGAIRPRAAFAVGRNASFTRGGSATTGWTFTLTLTPAPLAWVSPCEVPSCGDDTAVADFTYEGFLNGWVTDLTAPTGHDPEFTFAQAGLVDGFLLATNAQYTSAPVYDSATQSLTVQLGNVHFSTAGVLATGTYETFLPNALLTGLLAVPDPAALAGSGLAVTRTTAAGTTSAPFTLTHVPGGVRLAVSGITFSAPIYRVRALTRPSAPRSVSAVRTGARTGVVRFRAPLRTGGFRLTQFVARCTAPGRRTQVVLGRGAPLRVALAPGVGYRCTVAAKNARGWSPASRAAAMPRR